MVVVDVVEVEVEVVQGSVQSSLLTHVVLQSYTATEELAIGGSAKQ